MLTLAEYLRELKLMKQQYGQEEDLYPLIYMLLHENDNMKSLSLRMIEKGGGKKKLRDALYGYYSVPDFVIFDETFENKNIDKKKMYGCVEVKTFVNKTPPVFEFVKSRNKEISIGMKSSYYVSTSKENLKKENVTVSINDKIAEKYAEVRTISDDDENIKEICKSIGESSNGIIFTKLLNVSIDDNSIEVNAYRKSKNKNKDNIQFIAELLWYGKVLYTKGTVWRYYEIKPELRDSFFSKWGENNNDWLYPFIGEGKTLDNILCIEIGNLEKAFIKVKSGKIKTKNDIEQLVIKHPEWQQEWEQLKSNLACIDWKGTNDSSKFILKEDRNANQTDTP